MAETPRTGVIHDIGYRHYDGPRESDAAIARSLFVTGLKHTYGLGRSGRSKILPGILLGAMLLPVAILVGVMAIIGLDEPPVTYAGLTNQTQLLVTVFMAAQAPALFSRDLRHRTIVLYMARPLSSGTFVLCRWLSLVASGLVLVVGPNLVYLLGALLSGADAGEQVESFARSLPTSLLACVLLASLTGLVSSLALRRGFAVVGSVLVLAVSDFIVTPLQWIAADSGNDTVGTWLGLFSPWRIVNGLADAFDAGVSTMPPPEGTGMVTVYVVVALAVSALCLLALRVRFAKAGRR
ncbi:MAG: ABC transporter permease [Nocardioides sp.]|uniref:ABC transporter permease n=1 Tax=Nocardioides sp. TaxID=35761 RepID=UPI003EFE7466